MPKIIGRTWGAVPHRLHHLKEISMEIGKDYFEPLAIPNTTTILSKALEDIKEVIAQDPNREIVGQSSLTLMRIYDIIEEAEKQVDLKHG